MRHRNLSAAAALLAVCGSGAFAQAPDLVVGVNLETNINYNFNRPYDGQNALLFNRRTSSVQLNLGEVNISRVASSTSPIGFRVSLVDGEVARILLSPDFNLNSNNLLEAYVTTDLGRTVVQAGQFTSHVGYETVKVGSDPFFSKSYQFQLLQPIIGGGVRTKYQLDARTAVVGVLQNRFQGLTDDGNRDLAYGYKVFRQLSGRSSASLSGLHSLENLGTTESPNNRWQSVINGVFEQTLGDDDKVAFDGTYRYGRSATGRGFNVSGIGGYLVHRFPNSSHLGLRAEYLSQSNATAGILPTATGSTQKPSLSSITVSYELATPAFPGARTLLEFRVDTANDSVFAGRSGDGQKRNQSTLNLGQVFRF
jgi:hypothetical protein